jgi:hypothetical protein
MRRDPSLKGLNGDRDEQGRFRPGWRGGPGNPFAKQVNRLRAALLRCVKPADIRAIADALVEKAKGGDVFAAREVLRLTVGSTPRHVDRVAEAAVTDALVVAVVERIVSNVEQDFAPEARRVLRDWLTDAAGLNGDGHV